jgi:site-specific DNA recombinase
MKVAAYIRVSTHMQVEEGYSLSAQRERLKAFAFSQGWEIVQFYVDEGLSAKDMERPELQRMLKAVEEEIFDIVLVYKLDRLTRSVIDLDKLLKIFSKHDVMFKSSTEVYDTTTATGRLFIRLVASMAQWERENLGERVRFGMQEKARTGKWAVSTPPLGYDTVDSELKVNPMEAAIIKEIYTQYVSGMGMQKIANDLNSRNIRTKKGGSWSRSSIQYILSNPIYHGTTRYNYRVNTDQYFEVEGDFQSIITEEEFHLARRMMDSRSSSHPRQATSRYIFSKVLKCARCGKSLVGKSSHLKNGEKTYYSYRYYCPNQQRGICNLPSINQKLVEQKFIQLLEGWNLSQEANELFQQETAATKEDHAGSIHEIAQELKEVEKRRSKWQYAWVNEMITDVDFQKRMNEENEKEKMLQKELNELTPKEAPSQDSNFMEYWAQLKEHWSTMEIEQKKQFILIAVRSITIDKISDKKTPDSIEMKEVSFN